MYAALDFLPAGVTLRPARYRDAWGIYALLYRHSRDFRPDRLISDSSSSLKNSPHPSSPILGMAIGVLGAVALQSPVLMGGLVTIGAGLLGLYALQWLTLIRDVSHYQVVAIGSQIVGCAKAQTVGLNLADTYISNLVISGAFRRQGLGSLLIRRLQQAGPTYLFCLPNRLDFYRRLGFDVVAIDRLPPALQDKLPGLPKQIIAMVYG
jgi:GNAT superfamily N-acetyltransferase